MKWLKTILEETIGLFVDDAAYAAAIVIWLAAMAALVRFTAFGSAVAGPLLFAGLAVILVLGAVRKARK